MQKSTAQKLRAKEITASKMIKVELVKKKYIDNRIFYRPETLEIVITGSDFWYKDMQGTILSTFKSTCGRYYKTVKPIIRKCEYGLISCNNCEEI